MTVSTRSPASLRGDYGVPRFQGVVEPIDMPMMVVAASTAPRETDVPEMLATALINSQPAEFYLSAVAPPLTEQAGADAAVIQIWEGTVLAVDSTSNTIDAKLHAKLGALPDHVGQIDREWIADQDIDLVTPGAVFYLTLYKERKTGGTIVNSQELRFRRRPSWSKQQIALIETAVESLMAKLRADPLAND